MELMNEVTSRFRAILKAAPREGDWVRVRVVGNQAITATNLGSIQLTPLYIEIKT